MLYFRVRFTKYVSDLVYRLYLLFEDYALKLVLCFTYSKRHFYTISLETPVWWPVTNPHNLLTKIKN